jgi:MIZ/SP-RING zinc finger
MSATIKQLSAKLTRVQLSNACVYFKIARYGSKDDLVDRLMSYFQTNPTDIQFLPSAIQTPPETPIQIRPKISVKVNPNKSFSSPNRQAVPLPDSSPSSSSSDSYLETCDPFFTVISSTSLPIFSATATGSRVFHLDLPLLEWRRSGYLVFLRGASQQSTKTKFAYPKSLVLFINGQIAFDLAPPKPLRKRRDDPIDITKFLRSGANNLRFEIRELFNDGSEYKLGIFLCKAVQDKEIKESIDTENSECSKMRLVQILLKQQNSLEVVAEESSVVELTCPVSQIRVCLPARGKDCEHLRCFDLDGFIFALRHTANINLRWKCPICAKQLRPENLVIDGFFLEILNQTQLKSVIFETDGTWRQASSQGQKEEESENEKEEDDGPYVAETLVTKNEPLILCLDDDEEQEETQRPPKKQKVVTEVIDLCD